MTEWPPQGVWRETSVILDELLTDRPLVNLLTHKSLGTPGHPLPVDLLLGKSPVAVLGNRPAV
jgi:hypothetical protein